MCNKCQEKAKHSIQIREGDPSRDADNPKPDKSKLRVVGLCQEHWEELRLFVGLAL